MDGNGGKIIWSMMEREKLHIIQCTNN